MKIKRIVAEIKIDWLADDGKHCGALSFAVESDAVCQLEELPAVIAKAVAVPVSELVPPKQQQLPLVRPPAVQPAPVVDPTVRMPEPSPAPVASDPTSYKRRRGV